MMKGEGTGLDHRNAGDIKKTRGDHPQRRGRMTGTGDPDSPISAVDRAGY
jgi:hypothetical protein